MTKVASFNIKSTRGQFLLIIIAFALIGGVYYVVKSFADTPKYSRFLSSYIDPAGPAKYVDDQVPQLGTQKVGQLPNGGMIGFFITLGNEQIDKNCYYVRAVGPGAATIQLTSGKKVQKFEINPNPSKDLNTQYYKRICVNYLPGNVANTPAFSVKNLNGDPVNVYADDQIFSLSTPTPVR